MVLHTIALAGGRLYNASANSISMWTGTSPSLVGVTYNKAGSWDGSLGSGGWNIYGSGFPSTTVFCVYAVSESEIYFGMSGSGVYKWNGSSMTQIYASGSCYSITRDLSSGTMYFGFQSSPNVLSYNGVDAPTTLDSMTYTSYIYGLEVVDGVLFIAGTGGLAKYDGTTTTLESGIQFYDLFYAADGYIYYGGNSGGLKKRLPSDGAGSGTTVATVSSGSVYGIWVTEAGHIWVVGTYNGIAGSGINNVAYYNGSSWAGSSGYSGTPYNVLVDVNGNVFVSNSYTSNFYVRNSTGDTAFSATSVGDDLPVTIGNPDQPGLSGGSGGDPHILTLGGSCLYRIPCDLDRVLLLRTLIRPKVEIQATLRRLSSDQIAHLELTEEQRRYMLAFTFYHMVRVIQEGTVREYDLEQLDDSQPAQRGLISWSTQMVTEVGPRARELRLSLPNGITCVLMHDPDHIEWTEINVRVPRGLPVIGAMVHHRHLRIPPS